MPGNTIVKRLRSKIAYREWKINRLKNEVENQRQLIKIMAFCPISYEIRLSEVQIKMLNEIVISP